MKTQSILLFVVIIATALLYVPSLKNDFNNWNDSTYITSNSNIELKGENIKQSFLQGEYYGEYAPLTALSYSFIHKHFGGSAKPHIVFNLMVHLCNTLLLFVFLSLLIKNPWVALFTTVLFALHPIQAGSVACVSGRSNMLYVLFMLLSLILYLRWWNSSHKKWLSYSASLLFALLAGISGAQALALPVIILLISAYGNTPIKNKRFLYSLMPFIVIALLLSVQVIANYQFQSGYFIDGIYITSELPLYLVFVFKLYGIVESLWLLIIPGNHSVVSPYPDFMGSYHITIYMYLYIGLFAGLLFLFFRYALKNKLLVFGFTLYAVSIISSILFKPGGYGLLHTELVYFAAAGGFILISLLITTALKHKILKPVVIVLFSVYLIVSCAFTFKQTQIYKNSFWMWNDVTKNHPGFYLAYERRANYYLSEGNHTLAIEDYKTAIKLNPGMDMLRINLANAYNIAGEYHQAVSLFSEMIHNNPSVEAYFNRANSYLFLQEYDKAIDDLNQAIRMKPDYSEAYNDRGVAHEKKGLMDNALEDYLKAFAIDNKNYLACFNCAKLYGNTGEYATSLDYINKTIKLNDKYAPAYNVRGILLAHLEKTDEAFEDFSKAIEIDSNFAEAYNNRGSVYYNKGQMDKAIADYTKAAEIAPGFAEAFNNRGAAYIAVGETEKACSDFTIAAQIGHYDAKENLTKFCSE